MDHRYHLVFLVWTRALTRYLVIGGKNIIFEKHHESNNLIENNSLLISVKNALFVSQMFLQQTFVL